MRIKTEDLRSELTEITRINLNKVETFKMLCEEELNFKENINNWSILECIEHLNLYGNFYIPEIEKQIKSSKYKKSETFESGKLGNYFAKSMLPKEKLNKIKTFKSMNPIGRSLNNEVLNTFIEQQHKLLDLLAKSKEVNMSKIKTAISISKWIKLRLGDTFRVVIYHNKRHVIQAEKVPVGKNKSFKE